jgi:hypothetical protein
LGALPAFTQEADASVAYVPQTNDAIGFDVTVSYQFDIEEGEGTYSYNTYAIGCTDRLTVTNLYSETGNTQSMSWAFPSSINYLCGISELADYTNFVLTGVDWNVNSDGNGQWIDSSSASSGTETKSGFYSDDGVVYGTFTAHYLWET